MQDVSYEPLMLCPSEKSLKQAWTFSVSPTITLSGLCIHRKAINKDKPSRPLEVSVLPRIGRIEWISLRILGARQKQHKPLAVDARCLLRAIDAVPV